MPRKPAGITVAELRAELRDYPDDTIVVFAYTYPDHWHTEVVEEVASVDEGVIEWSEYHSKFKTLDEDEAEEGMPRHREDHEVVVLRG